MLLRSTWGGSLRSRSMTHSFHAKDKPIATALQSVMQRLGNVPLAHFCDLGERKQNCYERGRVANSKILRWSCPISKPWGEIHV
jgi:hypothetical protein